MRTRVALAVAVGLVLAVATTGVVVLLQRDKPGGRAATGSQATAGRSDQSPDRRSSPPASAAPTITANFYELAPDAEAAIQFTGSEDIFEARVIGRGATQKGTTYSGETIVYAPVTVTVTSVYRGSLKPGDQVLLCDLGGTAPDGTRLIINEKVQDSTYQPGTQLFAFTQGVVAGPGDIPAMRTPNYVFQLENGRAVNAMHPENSMDAATMRKRLNARWG